MSAPAVASNIVFDGFAHGSQSVSYSLNYAPGSPENVSGSANAGGFLTRLNGGASFESYCVDLYQAISFGVTYSDYDNFGTSHVFRNGNAYRDLGRLYAVAGVVNDAVREAAFQTAVWEIAYEVTGANYLLGGGAATFSSNGAVLAQATTWLNAVSAFNGSAPDIQVIQGRGEQDVMTAVPEPETYALLVAGLAAVRLVTRRRRS